MSIEQTKPFSEKLERPPVLDRIVSQRLSQSEKEAIADEWLEKFEKQEIEEIQNGEIELSSRQKELVAEAARLTDKILETAGVKSKTRITPSMVHLVKPDVFFKYSRKRGERNSKLTALASIENQAILIKNEERNELEFLNQIVHEMLHLNSFVSLQSVDAEDLSEIESNESVLTARRMGLRIQRTEIINGKKVAGKMRFNELDEALTEKLTADVIRNFDLRISPDLKTNFKKSEKLRRIMIEYLLNVFNTKSSLMSKAELSELLYFYAVLHWQAIILPGAGEFLEEYEKHNDPLVLENAISFYSDQETAGVISYFAYGRDRVMFENLVNEIFIRNKDKFNSPIDVVKLFAKASYEGRLLPLARIIEKTFGKGSFQKLGEGIDITIERLNPN